MKLNFIKTYSTIEPQRIHVERDIAYIRRNISTEIDDSGDIPVTIYNYEEAKLSIDQFNAYANQLLMNGQEDSTNNQLAIMEAFADLYETMLMNV